MKKSNAYLFPRKYRPLFPRWAIWWGMSPKTILAALGIIRNNNNENETIHQKLDVCPCLLYGSLLHFTTAFRLVRVPMPPRSDLWVAANTLRGNWGTPYSLNQCKSVSIRGEIIFCYELRASSIEHPASSNLQSSTHCVSAKIKFLQKIFKPPYSLSHNNLSFLHTLAVLHNWHFFQPECACPPHYRGTLYPHIGSKVCYGRFVLVIKISAIRILARRRRVNFGFRVSDFEFLAEIRSLISFKFLL